MYDFFANFSLFFFYQRTHIIFFVFFISIGFEKHIISILVFFLLFNFHILQIKGTLNFVSK